MKKVFIAFSLTKYNQHANLKKRKHTTEDARRMPPMWVYDRVRALRDEKASWAAFGQTTGANCCGSNLP